MGKNSRKNRAAGAAIRTSLSMAAEQAAQQAAEQQRQRDMIVANHLYRGELTLLQGPKGVGKSTLASQMAVSVANGVEFLKQKTTQTGVLYLQLEDDFNITFDRLKRQGFKEDTPLYFLPVMLHEVLPSGRVSTWPETLRTMLIRSTTPIGLIVIDPIFELVDVNDAENEAGRLKLLAKEFDVAIFAVSTNDEVSE